jgi:hypothetical protein
VSITYPSPFPYIIMLSVFLVIIAVCFFKIPSLRAYRRKRNLLIYAALLLIISLTAYQACDLFLGPAWVSYSIDDGWKQFYPRRINTFTVSSSNMGMRTASFNLIIKSVNASFVVDSQQYFGHGNGTEIKVPFSFPQGGTDTKTVHFTIDENVTSFSFDISVEGQVFVTSYTMQANGEWNSKTDSYTLNVVPGPFI